MPCAPRCGYHRCPAKVLPGGHQRCICHAPCMTDSQLYNPKVCQPCSAITMLLGRLLLTGLEPGLAAVHCRWTNYVKLCYKHGKRATWKDPDLPLLGMWRLVLISPSPTLKRCFKSLFTLRSSSRSFLNTRQHQLCLPLLPRSH